MSLIDKFVTLVQEIAGDFNSVRENIRGLSYGLNQKQDKSVSLSALSTKTIPAGDLVDTSSAQTLYNKTLQGTKITSALTYVYEYNMGNQAGNYVHNFGTYPRARVMVTGNLNLTFTFPGVGHYVLIAYMTGPSSTTITISNASGYTKSYIGSATQPAINTNSNGRTMFVIYYDGQYANIGVSKLDA